MLDFVRLHSWSIAGRCHAVPNAIPFLLLLYHGRVQSTATPNPNTHQSFCEHDYLVNCFPGTFQWWTQVCWLPEAMQRTRMSTRNWPQWITIESKGGSRWRSMLGPVSKGGAIDFLLNYGPVSQVSFITVSFLPDSTSEKRIEREEEQKSRRHTERSYCSCSVSLGLCFFSVKWQWDVALKDWQKSLGYLQVGKR